MPDKETINELSNKWGVLSNPKNVDILFYLMKENEPLSREKIADELEIPVSTAYKYLSKLEKAGFLRHEKAESGKLAYEIIGNKVYVIDEIYKITLEDLKKKIEKHEEDLKEYKPITKEKKK